MTCHFQLFDQTTVHTDKKLIRSIMYLSWRNPRYLQNIEPTDNPREFAQIDPSHSHVIPLRCQKIIIEAHF